MEIYDYKQEMKDFVVKEIEGWTFDTSPFDYDNYLDFKDALIKEIGEKRNGFIHETGNELTPAMRMFAVLGNTTLLNKIIDALELDFKLEATSYGKFEEADGILRAWAIGEVLFNDEDVDEELESIFNDCNPDLVEDDECDCSCKHEHEDDDFKMVDMNDTEELTITIEDILDVEEVLLAMRQISEVSVGAFEPLLFNSFLKAVDFEPMYLPREVKFVYEKDTGMPVSLSIAAIDRK